MSDSHDLDAHLMLRHDEQAITGTLCIGPKAPAEEITTHALMVFLESRGVPPRLIDQTVVEQIIADVQENPGTEQSAVIAHGKPARDGVPQQLAWSDQITERIEEIEARKEHLIDQAAPTQQPDEEPEPEGVVNHYAHSAFIIVEQDQAIGSVTPPDPGEDGEDIFGNCIAAKKSPKPGNVDQDSIELTTDNRVVARVQGRLRYQASNQTIERTLNIDGDVGFATGHVEFPGPVCVTGGVKDRFNVTSQGTTTIAKLIEAATIRSERDIVIERGVAGRELAKLEAHRHIEAGYLESCTARTGADCTVKREITNCDIACQGTVRVGTGAIRGGTIAAAMGVEAGVVGSAQEVRTTLLVGSIPELDGMMIRINELRRQAESELNRLNLELDTLKVNTETTTPQTAEKQMALDFEIDEIRRRANGLKAAGNRVADNIRANSAPSLTVASKVCGGVIVHIRGHELTFKDEVAGPFELTVDAKGDPVLIKGDSPKPASEVAQIEPSGLVPALPQPAPKPEPADTSEDPTPETADSVENAEAA